tara:strand:- start:450 stop:836 length:387 start_codon:yes stop_codon:yes gene_type:complete
VSKDPRFVYFFDNDAFEETNRPGFRRRVISGENLQLCFWRIADQATGSVIHRHDDVEQLGIIFRGALDFRIGSAEDVEDRTVLGPGDTYIANPGVWHGDSIFHGDEEYGECWILDVFAPPRDDLKEKV